MRFYENSKLDRLHNIARTFTNLGSTLPGRHTQRRAYKCGFSAAIPL